MTNNLLLSRRLGLALSDARKAQELTQSALAEKVDSRQELVARLETGLVKGVRKHDRLALLLRICDELDVAPMLVPRNRVLDVQAFLTPGTPQAGAISDVFDEVFIDLSGDDDDDDGAAGGGDGHAGRRADDHADGGGASSAAGGGSRRGR